MPCDIDAPAFQFIIKVVIRPFARAGVVDDRWIGGVDERRGKYRKRPAPGFAVVGTAGDPDVGTGVTDTARDQNFRQYPPSADVIGFGAAHNKGIYPRIFRARPDEFKRLIHHVGDDFALTGQTGG